MPSVDPCAAEIIRTFTEFDDSVAAAETALVVRNWPQIDAQLDRQHRLSHALTNLLDESRDKRPQSFTDEVNRRLALITERRTDQLRRLMAFNHLVKQRLIMISRTRDMRRVNVRSQPPPRILDMLQ